MKYRVQVSSRQQLTQVIAIPDFEYIYAPLEFLDVNLPEKYRIIAVPPVFLGGNESKIAETLKILHSAGFGSALAHTLGHIELIKYAGLNIHGGFRLNITNNLSLKKYKELGLTDSILSVELPLNKINMLEQPIPTGIIAYGKIPLMILRRCPVRDDELCGKSGCTFLTDRLGNKIQTLCRCGEVEVLNPIPIILSDKKPDADFIVLNFTGGEDIKEVLKKYKQGEKPEGKFTRGLNLKRTGTI